MKKVAFILVFLAVNVMFANAQGFKIAYANIDYILAVWPEVKKVESELKTFKSQLEKNVEGLYQEYQNKVADYRRAEAMMSDLVKSDKQKEIQNLESRIELMENNAKMEIMKKQEDLLEPLLEIVENKIKEIAKEKSYNYVLNQATSTGASIVLFAKDDADNITVDIMKKLGIKIPEELEKK